MHLGALCAYSRVFMACVSYSMISTNQSIVSRQIRPMRVLHLVLKLPVYDETVRLDEDIVLQRLLHTQQVTVDGLGLGGRKYFGENISVKMCEIFSTSARAAVSVSMLSSICPT